MTQQFPLKKGWFFDMLECGAQILGFQTHDVKICVKSIKEKIKALGGVSSGNVMPYIAWSQGGLIFNNSLKYLSQEEKRMIHLHLWFSQNDQ